jgi:hypothetical protein
MAEKKSKASQETPKGNELKEYQEKLIEWYETDSAKAIATVIAILLIPGAVLAWNYFSIKDLDRPDGQITDEASSTSIYDEVNDKPDFTEIFSDKNEDPIVSPTPTPTDLLADITPKNPVTTEPIDSVKKLPNTNGEIYYRVRKGDNYYEISKRFCGNDSFYRKNIKKNYLRESTVISVNCN